MIKYDKSAFGIALLWRVHGSAVYRSYLPAAISVGIVLFFRYMFYEFDNRFTSDSGLTKYEQVRDKNSKRQYILDSYCVEAYIGACSFLIVARCGIAYSRYWQAVSSCIGMMSKFLDVTIHASVFHLQSPHYDHIKPPSYYENHELNRFSLTRTRTRIRTQMPDKEKNKRSSIFSGMSSNKLSSSTWFIDSNNQPPTINSRRSLSTPRSVRSSSILHNSSEASASGHRSSFFGSSMNNILNFQSIDNVRKSLFQTDKEKQRHENPFLEQAIQLQREVRLQQQLYLQEECDPIDQQVLGCYGTTTDRVPKPPKKLQGVPRLDGGWSDLFDDHKSTYCEKDFRDMFRDQNEARKKKKSQSMKDLCIGLMEGEEKEEIQEFSPFGGSFGETNIYNHQPRVASKINRPKLDKDEYRRNQKQKRRKYERTFLKQKKALPNFSSHRGGHTPVLFLQELAHLSSLMVAVALSTLRNDIDGAMSPLGLYIPGSKLPEVDIDKMPFDYLSELTWYKKVWLIVLYIMGAGKTAEERTAYNSARPLPVLGGVSDNEILFLQMSRGPYAKVTICQYWFLEFMIREHLAGSMANIHAAHISRLAQFLGEGMSFYNQGRKIMFIPFPFVHAQLTAVCVFTSVPAIAFMIEQYVVNIYIAILLCFFSVSCLSGIHEVAREMENPFRNIPNELPLVTFQAQYNEALCTMFAGYHPDAFWDPFEYYHGSANFDILEEDVDFDDGDSTSTPTNIGRNLEQ